MATARPFDPATSTRRFTVGAPDGVSAVVLGPLLAKLRAGAPGIHIAVRQILPSPARVWRHGHRHRPLRRHPAALRAPASLRGGLRDRHACRPPLRARSDAGAILRAAAPGRFAHRDPYGFVDEALARRGRARRMALTVPNFMLAVAIVAESDLVTALPRRFAAL
jgi:DNA-binding transcriptional LysR family regulator